MLVDVVSNCSTSYEHMGMYALFRHIKHYCVCAPFDVSAYLFDSCLNFPKAKEGARRLMLHVQGSTHELRSESISSEQRQWEFMLFFTLWPGPVRAHNAIKCCKSVQYVYSGIACHILFVKDDSTWSEVWSLLNKPIRLLFDMS